MNKTKPSADQGRHMITREQVAKLVHGLGDHPGGLAFRELLASSSESQFEIWLPKGYCNDCVICRPRS
jgi:hypothetical protein